MSDEPNRIDSDSEERDNDERRRVSTRLFYGGCFFLPWVWILNALYFRKILLNRSGDAIVRRNCVLGLIGASIWVVAFIVWVCVYQTMWSSWGSFGQTISIVYPKGQNYGSYVSP